MTDNSHLLVNVLPVLTAPAVLHFLQGIELFGQGEKKLCATLLGQYLKPGLCPSVLKAIHAESLGSR